MTYARAAPPLIVVVDLTHLHRAGALCLSLALVLAGCAVAGQPRDPLTRELTWFGYLAGDDIRGACRTGLDRYRFVYNAVYTEQVRAYDLSIDADGAGVLDTTVFGGIEVAEIPRRDPLPTWFGRPSRAAMATHDVAALLEALDASGFDDPPPFGARLDSGDFYWVVVACRSGRFDFNAFAAPGARFDGVAFLEPLLAHDGTGVMVNRARARPVRGMDRPGRPSHEAAAAGGPRFLFKVSELGIVYHSNP